MRLTIIADDNAVYVDGEAIYPLDLSGLDPTIHAVQWNGSKGEIEYRSDGDGNRPPNERISDMSPYQVFVDRWMAAKALQPVPAQETAVTHVVAD